MVAVLPYQTFARTDYLANFLNAYMASRGIQTNFTPGKITLALGEADAEQAVALQLIASAVALFARATTSAGANLDSWMADFKFPRLPAFASNGLVTFSSNSPVTQNVYIPVGTQVQTQNGTIVYQVIADDSQASFVPSLNSYVLATGETSVNVTMQAIVASTSYNVQANQLNQLVSPLFGIASVTNTGAIINGENPETDDAYRARFIDFIEGLAAGTEAAMLEAALAIQAGLKVTLFENVLAIGNPPTSFSIASSTNVYAFGNVVALIDDGTGTPSMNLLNAAYNALFAVRAYTIRLQVFAPEIIAPAIIYNVQLGPNGNLAADEPIIQNAVANYINAFKIGAVDTNGFLYPSDLVTLAMNTDANISNIEPGYPLINSSNANFRVQNWQELLILPDDVTVNTY